MKYILLFIYRILNIIYSIVIATLMFFTFPFWSLIGYLFMGSECFETDMDEWIEIIWDISRYPLYKFEEFIDNIDDIEFNFNKIWNNKFWK